MYTQDEDWQEPLYFGWFGENVPVTFQGLHNSGITHMFRNQYYPTSEPPTYVRQIPWWNPRDPFDQHSSAEYIPGKQKTPLYPRLSTLTKEQHLLGLKILSLEYGCQPWNFPKPSQKDVRAFKKIKYIYKKEQKEYLVWARNLWMNGDCARTLQLTPLLETVYDAQFKLKKNEIQTLPREYAMAAQIRLEPRMGVFEFRHKMNLKSVAANSLPMIDYPYILEADVSILKEYEVPVPCRQHPTRFILPHENTVTTLPLPDVNQELAQFALKNNSAIIASEKALQCLLESEQGWKIPVTIVEMKCSGGFKSVIVLGSRFTLRKDGAVQRSFQAYQHLLRCTFLTNTEAAENSWFTPQAGTSKHSEQLDAQEDTFNSESASVSCFPLKSGKRQTSVSEPCHPLIDDNQINMSIQDELQMESGSSEPDVLVVEDQQPEGSANLEYTQSQAELAWKQNFAMYYGSDYYEEPDLEGNLEAEVQIGAAVPDEEQKLTHSAGISTDIEKPQTGNQTSFDATTLPTKESPNIGENPASTEDADVIKCTCNGTAFEAPPPRSYQKWQVKNVFNSRCFDIIVHSSHKVQDKGWRTVDSEVILEPIVEWQPELGACKQSKGRVLALALAFMMRPKAILFNVRIDYKNGNIIDVDRVLEEKFTKKHGDKKCEIADKIYATFDQLSLLKPGQYILAHDAGHGDHAMVYSALDETAGASFTGHKLSLRPENENLTEAEEAALSKIPPEISRATLPYHKYQIILPRAFTTDKNQVKEPPEYKKVFPAYAPAALPPRDIKIPNFPTTSADYGLESRDFLKYFPELAPDTLPRQDKKRRKKDKKRKGKKRRTEGPAE